MRSVVVCLCAALLLSACGKKGNPLPPLVRVPAAPADFSVTRLNDRVYVRLTVPATNVDGEQPADVARVEVHAVTLEGPAPDLTRLDFEQFREASTLVASSVIRRPQPPPPAVKEGMPPVPMPPPPPGLDQGSTLVVVEELLPEVGTPVSLASLLEIRPTEERNEESAPFGALVAPPPGAGVQRYYYAVAVSPRERYGPPTALVPAPLGSTSGPPSAPRIIVNEDSMELSWTPPVDARGNVPAGDPEWLPARPIVPGPPPTTYDVYEVASNQSPASASDIPQPLTPEPIGDTTFTQSPITLGQERCFQIRAVDIVDGIHVRGPASPVACASFADTFAPEAPGDLVAVSVGGGVNLIWESSDSSDVAGYLVLRGEPGSATLTPLNASLVTTPSYRDAAVTPGTRYAYAVVAVDRAGNRSPESNRVEETAQ